MSALRDYFRLCRESVKLYRLLFVTKRALISLKFKIFIFTFVFDLPSRFFTWFIRVGFVQRSPQRFRSLEAPHTVSKTKMSKSKSARFTPLEVQKLLEGVEQYKDILLCKLTGKTASEDKKKGWAKVAMSVSAVDPLTPDRTGEQCSVKFRDLKSECRLYKRNQSATGGGPKMPEPSYFHIIMDILGPDTAYWEGIKEKADEPLPPSGWDVAGASGASEGEIVIELPADTLNLPVEDFLDMAVAEATIQNCHDQSGPSQAISLPQAAGPETGGKKQRCKGRLNNRKRTTEDEQWRTYVQKKIKLTDIQIQYYSLALQRLKRAEEEEEKK